VNVFRNGIVDVFDEALVERETAGGGEETFRHAVHGVVGFGVAECCNDIAVAEDDAIGGRAPFRQGAENDAEGADLILVEIPIAAVRQCPVDRGLKLYRVHANLRRGFFLPCAGRWIIGGGFLGGQGGGEGSDEQDYKEATLHC
jgi:hypothetical protein